MFQAEIPSEEKNIDRMTDEGVLFVVAGNETTGNALSIITYHVLSNPKVLKALREELVEFMPDSKTVERWQALEKLPYLVGHCPFSDEFHLIYEFSLPSLRKDCGKSSRLVAL